MIRCGSHIYIYIYICIHNSLSLSLSLTLLLSKALSLKRCSSHGTSTVHPVAFERCAVIDIQQSCTAVMKYVARISYVARRSMEFPQDIVTYHDILLGIAAVRANPSESQWRGMKSKPGTTSATTVKAYLFRNL